MKLFKFKNRTPVYEIFERGTLTLDRVLMAEMMVSNLVDEGLCERGPFRPPISQASGGIFVMVDTRLVAGVIFCPYVGHKLELLDILWVHKRWRRRGIGRKLVTMVQALAAAEGNAVTLGTSIDNNKMQTLATSLGFKSDFVVMTTTPPPAPPTPAVE